MTGEIKQAEIRPETRRETDRADRDSTVFTVIIKDLENRSVDHSLCVCVRKHADFGWVV